MEKRAANFELLRIVAMGMILTLHYLVKGFLPLAEAGSDMAVTLTARLLEAFCIVAVDCYVLLSGYFLTESRWKAGRVTSLFLQVWFYSLLIPFVMGGLGIISLQGLWVYDWIGFLFPLVTEHYWFATAYLAMYLFAPLLAAGVEGLEKRQLQMALGLLLAFFSLEKTVLPVRLVTDHFGYDFGWFLCLFVTAGYLRKYGLPWLEKRGRALACYAAACLAIWGLSLFSEKLGSRIDAFAYYADMPYTYNHVLCLVGAVSLFYVFRGLHIREGRMAGLIRLLAPCTFGVYLLHEHILVRGVWMKWLGVERVEGFAFLPHMAACVLLVFGLGTAVELARIWIFETIKKRMLYKEQ